MKVERNRVGNKYTFTAEDKEDEKFLDRVNKKIDELEEENKKLNEFKVKREESMFYFKAQMERAEPKTASEAEDLQRAKDIFEKLYREELSCLGEENKKLKEENKKLKEEGDMAITHNLLLIEKNKRLRKGIDIRLDSMGVKYIITEEGDYFAKSDFKITELFK